MQIAVAVAIEILTELVDEIMAERLRAARVVLELLLSHRAMAAIAEIRRKVVFLQRRNAQLFALELRVKHRIASGEPHHRRLPLAEN